MGEITCLCLNHAFFKSILGDPGADSGDEDKIGAGEKMQ